VPLDCSVIISCETHHVKNVLGFLISGELGEKDEGDVDGRCRGDGRDDASGAHNLGVSGLNSHLGKFIPPFSLKKVVCGRPASAEHVAFPQDQRSNADGGYGL
jgi:hypothetical protein